MSDEAWTAIYAKEISKHDFKTGPCILTAEQIKQATSHFKKTGEREVRILCKQDSRESRPRVFRDNDLFILPVKNGTFAIVKGEGYLNIPEIKEETKIYEPQLGFDLETSKIGNSEMQHLDYAYASSIIRTFMGDLSLVLTIRGRKYTPAFDFRVSNQKLHVEGVQTEVDAGYEGKNQVVLVEAKRSGTENVIIRQLFYPLRQWSHHTKKKVVPLFFEEHAGTFSLWEFRFRDPADYNSIEFVRSAKYKVGQ